MENNRSIEKLNDPSDPVLEEDYLPKWKIQWNDLLQNFQDDQAKYPMQEELKRITDLIKVTKLLMQKLTTTKGQSLLSTQENMRKVTDRLNILVQQDTFIRDMIQVFGKKRRDYMDKINHESYLQSKHDTEQKRKKQIESYEQPKDLNKHG